MRILLTTYVFPDDRQAFMEEYVLALLALGIEVCVVVSADVGLLRHSASTSAVPRWRSCTRRGPTHAGRNW